MCELLHISGNYLSVRVRLYRMPSRSGTAKDTGGLHIALSLDKPVTTQMSVVVASVSFQRVEVGQLMVD
jgi:hypothetical protein